MVNNDGTSVDFRRANLSDTELASLTPEQKKQREQYITNMQNHALTAALSGNDDGQRDALLTYRQSLTDKFNSIYTQMHDQRLKYEKVSSERVHESYVKLNSNETRDNALTTLNNYQDASTSFGRDGTVGDKIKLPSSVNDKSSTKSYLSAQVSTSTEQYKTADTKNTQVEAEYAQMTKQKDTADSKFQKYHDQANAVIEEQRIINNMLNLLG